VPLHEDKGAVVPFKTQPLPSRPRTGASIASAPALNVLVIDDTPEDRMAVRLALEAGGFVLQEAADAEHGLKLAGSATPDCILLDHVLPDAEGLEVLESLRQPDGTLPCAVVMLTGTGTVDVATAAMKAGALDYLVKDRLDGEMLRRVIGSAVRQFRLMEAQRVAERRNAQLAAIVAASDDAIISLGTDFVVQTWNAGAQRMFGYDEAEARGRTLTELIVPDVYEAESAAIFAATLSGGTVLKEILRRHKDGHLVPVEINTSPILDGSGGVTSTTVIYRDISERWRIEDALRASEERFRSSVLHSPLPILLFDDREQILALSQSWLEGSSYSREELGRIEDWTARAYGERSGEVLEHIRQIIWTEPEVREAEMKLRTKDGRERLWSFVCSALGAQSDGRGLFVCVAQDVTERKAHEEQVHLLMREVNHRAKNMLSLVQAIARQTAAPEPEDFIGRFTERIQALAANQDLLIRNEWQGVDVEDLVRAQLAHFLDLVGSRIAVHGPKLRLNAAAAQAVGLALHELATNAGKYGALSTDAGRVDVRWQLDGAIFAMSWTERNGPPVSRPERRGFGSTVIDSMVRATVDGEIELDYAPLGLVWRLTSPAANALERGA